MADDEKTRVLRGSKAADRPPKPKDEGSTRILSQPGAARGGEPSVGKIVFACPNGHRITVDETLAGKRGKCTKCGVDVVIPGPAGNGRQPGPAASPEPVSAPLPGSDVEFEKAGPEAESPEPAAPTFTMESTAADGVSQAGDDAPPESWDFIGGQPEAAAEAAGDVVGWPPTDDGSPFGDEGGNPTAQLVARLWLERNHGGIIELHLEGGSVILPEWYDANWSRGTHGLFGSRAGDSITITAVAWDTVQKVVVRQLTEMPDDMFT